MSVFATTLTSTAGTMGSLVLWMVVLFGMIYFMMLRPQQKETKRKSAMLSELSIGDTVLTTSGFYGTIIDVSEDTVIIEFGNNKNCRIPMQRSAISAVEKPEDSTVEKLDKKEKKIEKK